MGGKMIREFGNGSAGAGRKFQCPMGLLLGLVALTTVLRAGAAGDSGSALSAAVDNPDRTPQYAARDRYRHPAETLAFFGVAPTSTVVEIWPGGGWYTEILAPYLAAGGRLYAAHFPADSEVDFFRRSRAAFAKRVESEPELFAATQVTDFYPPSAAVAAPQGVADFVLTFRNVHNWLKAGFAEQAFANFASLLKAGGVLGVVEHRAKPGTSDQQMIDSGYVTEQKVIDLAERAGLVLQARSDINANPADDTRHPRGVWTLPPTLRLGDEDRQRYLQIGESDRMTLKFTKPQ